MKTTPRSIPSEFVRFDSATTTADRYVSVAEQQRLRANHNALISGAHTRTVLVSFLRNHTTAGHPVDLPIQQTETGGLADINRAARFFSAKILVSSYIESLSFRIRCRASRAAQTVNIYPIVSHPSVPRGLASVTPLSVVGAAAATYTRDLNLPVSRQRRDGYHEYRFDVYALVEDGLGPFVSPAVVITGALSDPYLNVVSIETPTAGLTGTEQVGDLMWCPSNALVESRIIISITAAAGTTTLSTSVKTPWPRNEALPTTADSVRVRQSPWLYVEHVELHEKPRTTDFSTLLRSI